MISTKRLIDANILKTLFDVRYDTAFIQERTRDNKERWNGYCTGINWGRNTIANAPTVDAVEVVHGYWELSIFNHPMSFFVDHTCSVCGHMERLDICASPLKWNYCPNCGAKMDGDGNAIDNR